MKPSFLIRLMGKNDPPIMSAAFAALGWSKPESQYRLYHREQEDGRRVTLVAFANGEFCGYGNVIWESSYPPFRKKAVPEISDLNVLPKFRRRGIATAIMDRAENLAFERSKVVGIGVGLYDGYGPAQRMYVLRGYVPDGLGVTRDANKRVRGGDVVCADDDLILWLTKSRK